MADKMKEAKKRLEVALEYLLTNPSTTAYLKQNKEFQTIIKNEIFILKSADDKDKKVDKLIEKYDTVSPVKYDNKPTVELKDDDDKIDYTNYLITYVYNIFKIDLKSIDKKDLNNVKKIEAKEVKAVDTNSEEAFAAGAAFGGMAGGGMAGGYGNFDPTSPTITIPNPAIQQQAQANVNDKLLRGEVYMFESKPKVIPIFKLIYTIVMCVLAAALIASCVCLFMLNGKPSTETYEGKTLVFGTIFGGVFTLIFSVLFIYMGFSDKIRSARMHAKTKTKPSDNEKYQVTGIGVGFTILFAVFIALMLIFPNMGSCVFTWGNLFANAADKKIWIALIVFTGISLFCLVLTIVCSIVLLTCKPKTNVNLLNRLMEEEMRKLMGSAEYAQPYAAPVQEAKVEEPKKEEPKKKDDKELKN